MLNSPTTVEELLASLERSDLPNLITEGKTDYSLLRHLAKDIGGDCLPAGNKQAVLDVCDRASQVALRRTALLVDADLWSIDGVPWQYSGLDHLVITNGYSIENDLLRDAKVEELIDAGEMARYRIELANVCDWFCAGVTCRRTGIPFDFNIGMSSVLRPDGQLTARASNHIAAYEPSKDLVAMVREEYPQYLRGKTWLGVLNRVFCAPGRGIPHPPLSLLDIGMRSQNEFSSRIKAGIISRF